MNKFSKIASSKLFNLLLAITFAVFFVLCLISFVKAHNSISFISLFNSLFNGFWFIPQGLSHETVIDYSNVSTYLVFQTAFIFLVVSLLSLLNSLLSKIDSDFVVRFSLLIGNIISLFFYHSRSDFASANNYQVYGWIAISISIVFSLLFLLCFICKIIYNNFSFKKAFIEIGIFALVWSVSAVILKYFAERNVEGNKVGFLFGLIFYIIPLHIGINTYYMFALIFDNCATSYAICTASIYCVCLLIIFVCKNIHERKMSKNKT